VAEEVSIRDLSNFDPSSHPAEERSDRKRTHFLQRQHNAEQSFSEVSSIDRALGQAPSEWKLVLLSQEPAWLDYVKPLVRQSLPTNLKIVEKWRKLGPDSLFPKFVFFRSSRAKFCFLSDSLSSALSLDCISVSRSSEEAEPTVA
jgi:hypothetical protein